MLRLNLVVLGDISYLGNRDRLFVGLVLRRINKAEELRLSSLFIESLILSEQHRPLIHRSYQFGANTRD